MKKILLVVSVFMLFCVPAFASEQTDAREILAMSKDVNYWTTENWNWCRKMAEFEQKYPKSPLAKQVLTLNLTILNLRSINIYIKQNEDSAWVRFYNDPNLLKYYPDIHNRVAEQNGWSNDNLKAVFLQYGLQQVTLLQQAMEDFYPEPRMGRPSFK